MIIPGDQGPIQEEEGLFRMKDLDTSEKLGKVAEDQVPILPKITCIGLHVFVNTNICNLHSLCFCYCLSI
jgi:hypothetical protein